MRFEGEIDIAFSRDEFAELAAAVRASGQPVDADCSAVRFFSAEGIRMLVLLKSEAVDNRLATLITGPALNRLGRAFPMESLLVRD